VPATALACVRWPLVTRTGLAAAASARYRMVGPRVYSELIECGRRPVIGRASMSESDIRFVARVIMYISIGVTDVYQLYRLTAADEHIG